MLKTSYPNEFLILRGKKKNKKQETPLHNTAVPSDSNAECVTETPVVITRKTGPMTITSTNRDSRQNICKYITPKKIFSGYKQHYLSLGDSVLKYLKLTASALTVLEGFSQVLTERRQTVTQPWPQEERWVMLTGEDYRSVWFWSENWDRSIWLSLDIFPYNH